MIMLTVLEEDYKKTKEEVGREEISMITLVNGGAGLPNTGIRLFDFTKKINVGKIFIESTFTPDPTPPPAPIKKEEPQVKVEPPKIDPAPKPTDHKPVVETKKEPVPAPAPAPKPVVEEKKEVPKPVV
jgi:outer membrane biosynthesis protein TonB